MSKMQVPADKTRCIEILHKMSVDSDVFRVASVKNEIFLLCVPKCQDPFIHVYDRDNIAVIKETIELPGIMPEDILGCNISNCLYILNKEFDCRNVWHVARAGEKFVILPFIPDMSLWYNEVKLCGSVDGTVLLLSHRDGPTPSTVSVYNKDGVLKQEVSLSKNSLNFVGIINVVQQSNGNLLLASSNIDRDFSIDIIEVDVTGNQLRRYESEVSGDSGITLADKFGDVAIVGDVTDCELIDCEFKSLLFTPGQMDGPVYVPFSMNYNMEMDEVVRLFEIVDKDNRSRELCIFRFTEK